MNNGYILVEGGYDMGQFLSLFFGIGLMIPLIVVYVCDEDSDLFAKVVGASIAMQFFVGFLLFLTGVFR